MKFLVDDNIDSEVRTVNYVDVGIHDDMELTDIKIDVSPKGNNFIAFTFTDPDGRVLTKTEWEPTGQEDDVLMKKIHNQAKRIKHIMTKYMAMEHTKIEYDTEQWVKYASTVKAKLDAVKGTTKVRIKAVYGNQNYVTLPNYLPFIERMDVEKTELAIQTIDKVTRDVPDTEARVSNPFDTSSNPVYDAVAPFVTPSATPTLNDSLPF